MRETKRTIITLLLVTLLGSLLSGSAWAKEIRTEKEARVDSAGIQALTELVLLESEDQSNWSVVDGTLAVGYTMGLNPALAFEYLDAQSVTASPALADGMYGFILDTVRVPADYYSYWAAKGVDENAAGDGAILWDIITGVSPMFYLKVSSGGTAFDLIDGFLYLANYGEFPLRVNGDYPVYTYNFEGTVQDTGGGSQTFVVGITFNRQATVSIVGDTFTIDGCGYIDLYIHVANAINLYALDVSVEFDETKVEVMDLDPVAGGINLEPVDGLFDAAYWVYNQANNSTGEIRYAATQYRPSAPMTGSDNVAKIRLRAKDFGTSLITVTAATLSDRDGYLVGVPLVLDTNDVITTTWGTSGVPELDIIRLDVDNVKLSWPKQVLDAGAVYRLYRSPLPYFNLQGGTLMTGYVEDTINNKITFTDPVLQNVATNYFYAMDIQCSSGLVSPASWWVGKFEYRLHETMLTDYSFIGLVLEVPGLTNTAQLADHIETNSNGTVDVISISRWNGSAQQFDLYLDDPYEDPGSVQLKRAYQIEIDISGTESGSVIWAQVGRLPIITTDTYTLYDTITTDYSWILQPLDMTTITDTDQLINSIQSVANVNQVVSISRWNGSAQQFDVYTLGGDKTTTRFGYPYQVEVDINGYSVTWP